MRGRETLPQTHPQSTLLMLRESEGTQTELRTTEGRRFQPGTFFHPPLSTLVFLECDASEESAGGGLLQQSSQRSPESQVLCCHPSVCFCSCSILYAPLHCPVSSYSSLKTQLRHASSRKPSLPLLPQGQEELTGANSLEVLSILRC